MFVSFFINVTNFTDLVYMMFLHMKGSCLYSVR